MFFGLIKIDKSEPEIVELSAPINMVGVSMRTGMKTIFKDAVTLGKEYRKIKDQGIVLHKEKPWAFVAISRNFSIDNSSWEYLMGDVVTSFDGQPRELIQLEIPAKKYAVFAMRARFKFLWGPTIGLTKKYVYSEWLPRSGYEVDSKIVGEFEFHDERSTRKKPLIELFVSIKEKK